MSDISNKDIRDHLIRGRQKIEKGWTYGTLARSADGYPVGAESSEACKWCAMGAVMVDIPYRYQIRDPLEAAALDALNRVIREGEHQAVPKWLKDGGDHYILPPIMLFNDKTLKDIAERKSVSTAQQTLLEVFDIAIKRVEARDA